MFKFLIKDKDFYKRALALALPLLAQNLLSCSLGLADSFIIGLMGEANMAAVAVYSIPNTLVYSFSFGAQGGISILASQFWGKKDSDSINRSLGIGLISVGTITFLYALIINLIPRFFFSFFSNDPATIELVSMYGRPVVIANALNTINLVYVATLRSMGQVGFGTTLFASSMVMNIALDWVLGFGGFGIPAMGLKGVAWATLIVRAIESAAVLVHILVNRKFRIKPSLLLRPGMDITKLFFKNAGVVMLNESIWGAGTSAISNVFSHMKNSTSILAARSIASNVEWIAQCGDMSFSAATSVIVGNSIGEGKSDEEVKDIGKTLALSTALVGVLQILIMMALDVAILPAFVYPAFGMTQESIEICSLMIRMGAMIMPLRYVTDALVTGVFRGAGDTRVATLIDCLPLWLAAVPYAHITGRILELEIGWVYLAFTVQYVLQTFFSVKRVSTSKWIHNITTEVEE